MSKRLEKIKNKKYHVVLIVLVFTISTGVMAEGLYKNIEDMSISSDAALEKLKMSMPEIAKIMEENPKDLQIRQGAAEIYWRFRKTQNKTVSEYEKAVGLDADQENLQTGLMVAYIREFRRVGGKDILEQLIKQSEQLEKRWPENAFYNYVRAYVHLEREENDNAEMEIQNALGKPYLRQHLGSIVRARDRVLFLMEFPFKYKVVSNPVFDEHHWFPIKPFAYLRDRARDYQQMGEYKEAINLYRDCLGILKHLQQDVFSYMWVDVGHELVIYEKIHECYEKQGLEVEAEEISRKIEHVKREKEEIAKRGEAFFNFLLTADREEIKERYERMLEEGWF